MLCVVDGKFGRETLAGMTSRESAMFMRNVIKPSLDAITRLIKEKRIVGGVVARGAECTVIMGADSNSDIGKILTGLQFWESTRWTISPIESPESALDLGRREVQLSPSIIVER